ncbi:hypothetical protein IW140_004618 [Coemansia sp. RSA 1813]|nr:hypothetical protein EV178_002146 [Coemansia sp. RSA 1646]KAJ1767695.1 hypothetical protein LPJ74_005215 [Coemansia sp. RSA 1843]KAJ2090354.1 hypothetical protein IW138_002780 [Coemansia sp. RSA 986]KAJ2215540.1 hypothetical protein EV179_002133 [Coemansia sp. RSA 487]KAJ2567193.1 hypothetical protein IW140_004618 [Coemansia sp. RSA 1813]
MSLADLYRTNDDDLEQDESSDDGEFVLEEEDNSDNSDANESGSDSGEKNDDGSNDKTAAVDEHRKRRIDDIWGEMNAPTGEKRAGKAARIDDPADDKASDSERKNTHNVPDTKEAEAGDGSVREEQHPTPKEDKGEPSAEAASRAPMKHRRPVSKFSKMAEMVERRRAKRENTLDTARRQWTGFVDSKGIRDDLDRANKDGFVERQEFLRRVDERTYQNSKTHHQK